MLLSYSIETKEMRYEELGLVGPGVNEEKEWEFPKNIELTTIEKKIILALW